MATPQTLETLEADLQHRTRHLGAHYTPEPIAQRAAATALAPLCHGRPANDILRLRILDPAVGSGRFLAAALDFLAQATGRPAELRPQIAATCLYGIDIHADAAALARRTIAQAAGIPAHALRPHIIAADALLADIPAALGTATFHAILTNPPWLSYSGRQAAAIEPARRRRLAQRYAAFRRWPTAHGAFLELAARLLAADGRAALIVPQQVCHLAGYQATRHAVRQHCHFAPPPEPLGERAFPGVTQPAAIVHLHRPVAPAADCVHAPTSAPAIHAASPDIATRILRKLRQHPPAPPEAFRDPGVHSGNSARLILRPEPGPGHAPVREGRCVQAFALAPAHKWLATTPDLPEGHYCTIRTLATYQGARIVLRQTANRPIAARHVDPTYFRNSVLACTGVDGLDDTVLLGLLNSSLLAFAHRHSHADGRQKAFPQVKIAHLRALPLARTAHELGPIVLRLEATAAQLAACGQRLTAEMASLLSCPPEEFVRGRVGALARQGDAAAIARTLGRRLPQVRKVLGASSAQRAVAEAGARARTAIEPLEHTWRSEMRRLDQCACRAYDLTDAEARYVAAHTEPA